MLILPLMPHRVAQKCNFVHDFANNAARKSKTYQASRGLSTIAELLVNICSLLVTSVHHNMTPLCCQFRKVKLQFRISDRLHDDIVIKAITLYNCYDIFT